ncbi:hypothetical protein KO498_06085 [Lentibacter algarum]|uniref:hypothetical protein n=1 Tax=Lentibacter algarum TaxID=576131 RepID=UPI001C075248|nr:hypothetical protein [Lentibacter algarum]MBU2981379.1 hypothetical protein [Lentibacter algarum]
MNKFFALLAISALTACGGNGYKSASSTARSPAKSFATGPISKACMASDRKARSRELCGCVQAVANLSLSSRDQAIAASFYKDPQRSQDMRQSDNANHERFWLKYKEYGQTSQELCG